MGCVKEVHCDFVPQSAPDCKCSSTRMCTGCGRHTLCAICKRSAEAKANPMRCVGVTFCKYRRMDPASAPMPVFLFKEGQLRASIESEFLDDIQAMAEAMLVPPSFACGGDPHEWREGRVRVRTNCAVRVVDDSDSIIGETQPRTDFGFCPLRLCERPRLPVQQRRRSDAQLRQRAVHSSFRDSAVQHGAEDAFWDRVRSLNDYYLNSDSVQETVYSASCVDHRDAEPLDQLACTHEQLVRTMLRSFELASMELVNGRRLFFAHRNVELLPAEGALDSDTVYWTMDSFESGHLVECRSSQTP
eukprot:TRINITY_DN301_c0_g1_i9.p1 TRINITY_DN301_c0_g1~~TRINITY_DN301_c0_g1_i9.p1  ORF type:complete len:302 (+),score=60.91 TRINITY_DN301_c0_g1_i9:96-1001(+)